MKRLLTLTTLLTVFFGASFGISSQAKTDRSVASSTFKKCKPFIIGGSYYDLFKKTSMDSVTDSFAFKGCTLTNESYFGIGFDFRLRGLEKSLSLLATDFPKWQAALNAALKARAVNGFGSQDIDFAHYVLLKALADAEDAASPDESKAIISEAKIRWKDYLLSTNPR